MKLVLVKPSLESIKTWRKISFRLLFLLTVYSLVFLAEDFLTGKISWGGLW